MIKHFKPLDIQECWRRSSVNSQLDKRADFYVLFKICNPIAWLLIYRWLIVYTLTAEERKHFFFFVKEIEERGYLHHSSMAEEHIETRFILNYPYLFLCLLPFQFLIKKFTAVGEVINRLWSFEYNKLKK